MSIRSALKSLFEPQTPSSYKEVRKRKESEALWQNAMKSIDETKAELAQLDEQIEVLKLAPRLWQPNSKQLQDDEVKLVELKAERETVQHELSAQVQKATQLLGKGMKDLKEKMNHLHEGIEHLKK